MIVVDASAVLEVLLQTAAAPAVSNRFFGRGDSLHTPHLLDVEVAQVLRRYAAARELDERRGHEALEDLRDFPLTRYPHDILLERVWALRHQLTAYDAVYIALAEALRAPLVTRDRRLASSHGHRAKIELV